MPVDLSTYFNSQKKKNYLNPEGQESTDQEQQISTASPTSHIDSFISKHQDRDPEILKEGHNAILDKLKNRDGDIKYGAPITVDDLEKLGRERIKANAPGLVSEGLKSLGRGLVDFPGMVGRSMQWLDPNGGNETVSNAGKALEDFSNRKQEEYAPTLGMSKEAELSGPWTLRHMVAQGPESMVGSLAPFAAGAATAAVAGPVAGIAAGIGTLGTLFYGGSAEQKYRQGIESGLSDEDATALANWEGGIEAGGELIADAIPIGIFGKFLSKPAKSAILKGITSGVGAKETIKQIGRVILAETATEVGQAAGQTYASQQYGVDVGDIGENMADVVGPTIFMSILFGGAGSIRNININKHRSNIVRVLSDPQSDQAEFDTALSFVSEAASKIDPDLSKAFVKKAEKARANGQPVILDNDEIYRPLQRNLSTWLETGQRNGQPFTPEDGGIAIREGLQTGEIERQDLDSLANTNPALKPVVHRIMAELVVEDSNRQAEEERVQFQSQDEEDARAFDAEFQARGQAKIRDLKAQREAALNQGEYRKTIESDPLYQARQGVQNQIESVYSEGAPVNEGQDKINQDIREFLQQRQFKNYAKDAIKQKQLGEEFQKKSQAENKRIDNRLVAQRQSIVNGSNDMRVSAEQQQQRAVQEELYKKKREKEFKEGKNPAAVKRISDYQSSIIEGSPRAQRVAKKAQAIDIMINQANGSQTRSFFEDPKTGEKVNLPATSPGWMKEFNGNMTRKEIQNVATKYKEQVLLGNAPKNKNDAITEKQKAQVREYILPAINRIYNDHADEFTTRADFEKEGYKFVDAPIVAFDFKPGDSLLGFKGNIEASEVIKNDDSGITIKTPDGQTHAVDGFDPVQITAFKEGNGKAVAPEGYYPKNTKQKPEPIKQPSNKETPMAAEPPVAPVAQESVAVKEPSNKEVAPVVVNESPVDESKVQPAPDSPQSTGISDVQKAFVEKKIKEIGTVQGKIAASTPVIRENITNYAGIVEDSKAPFESDARTKFKDLDDARKDFIDKKILEAGSIKAVQAKYSDDAVVDNYARERAGEIFGEVEPTPNKSENPESQQPTEEPQAKQAWEMTREEFVSSKIGDFVKAKGDRKLYGFQIGTSIYKLYKDETKNGKLLKPESEIRARIHKTIIDEQNSIYKKSQLENSPPYAKKAQPVSASVLADYPDLAEKYRPAQKETPEAEPATETKVKQNEEPKPTKVEEGEPLTIGSKAQWSPRGKGRSTIFTGEIVGESPNKKDWMFKHSESGKTVAINKEDMSPQTEPEDVTPEKTDEKIIRETANKDIPPNKDTIIDSASFSNNDILETKDMIAGGLGGVNKRKRESAEKILSGDFSKAGFFLMEGESVESNKSDLVSRAEEFLKPKPFKFKDAAILAVKKAGATDTHDIIGVDGGWIGRHKEDIKKTDEKTKESSKIKFSESDMDYQTAYNAYANTSFDPEKRAKSEQAAYIAHMNEFQDEILSKIDPELTDTAISLIEGYRKKYLEKYSQVLNAKSRTMSPMITGPANFPVRRNQKALDVEHKRWEEFKDWSEKAQKAINRDLGIGVGEKGSWKNPIMSNDPDALELLKKKLEGLKAEHERTKKVAALLRNKKLSKEQKIKELEAIGTSKESASNLLEEERIPSFVLANSNANIKRIEGRILELKRLEEQSTQEYPFEGGKIIDNVEDVRTQILFDEKPNEAMRAKLKARGFKWSPKNNAWQRQRTRNALADAQQIVKQEAKFSKTESKPATPSNISELSSYQKKLVNALVRKGRFEILSNEQAQSVLTRTGESRQGKVQAFVTDNKTHIIPENIEPGKLWNVIRHETGVHVGQLLHNDAEFNKLKDSIERRRNDNTIAGEAIRKAYARVPAETKPEHVTEEVLGYLVESAPNISISRRIIALVKKYLQKIGINFDLNQADMAALADMAIRREAYRKGGGMRGKTKLSTTNLRNTDTQAFKDWFGDSKVMDDEGNPLVVYHGTATQELNTFTHKKATDKTGRNMGLGLGKGKFYFTESEKGANLAADGANYRGDGKTPNIVSAFLKIVNPISQQEYETRFKEMFGHDLSPATYSDTYSKADRDKEIKKLDAIIKKEGYDGIWSKELGQIAVFNPTQIKSIYNAGTSDPNNPDIRYSISPAQQADPISIPDKSTMFDNFKYNFINALDPIKKIQETIGSIPQEANLFDKETLRISKAKSAIDRGDEKYVNPMLKDMAKVNFNLDDVGEYLHSRHAPEANERLKYTTAKSWLTSLDKLRNSGKLRDKIKEIDEYLKKNPLADPKTLYFQELKNQVDNIDPANPTEVSFGEAWKNFISKASGMDNDTAQKIQEKWKADPRYSTMLHIASLFDKMNQEKLDISLKAGRMTPEEHKAISGTFEYYAPLHREGYDSAPNIGRGLSNLGRDFMARGGSTKPVVDILANAVADYKTTIVKAHKAESTRAFMNLVEGIIDQGSDLFKLIQPDMKAEYDASGNIRYVPDRALKENQVQFKLDGITYIAEAKKNNEYAMRMLEHIKFNPEKTGYLVNALNKVNRVLALVNTSLSPEFMFTNLLKDLQTASVNLSDTQVAGMTKQILMDVPKAMNALHSSTRGNNSHEWAGVIKQYNKSGAPIGWMDNIGNAKEKARQLEKEIDMMRPLKDIKGSKQKAFISAKKLTFKVFDTIMDYNSIVENAVRLSTFNAGVKAGMSTEKAAVMARALTVNFNQKGTMGAVINSLWLFSNAGIQGSAKIVSVLVNSKRARKIVGASMLTSMALAMANRSMGGGDDDGIPYYDKIDQFVKERNIIIMIPGTKGKYTQFPLPWGYNVFWAMGEEMGMAFGTDKKYDPIEGASRMLTTTLNAFNPLQSSTIAQTMSPTVFDPFVQVAENKTWSGSPLMPEGDTYSKIPTPDSQKYWKSARGFSVYIAQLINELSLGNEVKPGSIDVSPETLDLVWDTFTGSTGKFIANTGSSAIKALSGEDVSLREIPFARRFAGEKSEYADSKLFRANVEHIYQLHDQVEKYPERAREWKKDKSFYLMNTLKSTEKSIKRLSKVKKTAPTTEAADKIQARIDALMTKFNAAFYKVSK